MSEQIPAGWYPDPQDTTSEPRPERWWDGRGWTATTRPGPATQPGPRPESTADQQVLVGEVLSGGPTVRYPELPVADAGTGYGPGVPHTRRKPPKTVAIAATVAALAGLAVGSGVTYLAMDHKSNPTAAAHPARAKRGNGFGGPGLNGGGPGLNGGGSNGGGPGLNGGGSSNGGGPGLNGGGSNGGSPGLGGGPGGGGGSNGGGLGGGPGGGGGLGGGSTGKVAVDIVNGISLPVPSGWKGGTTDNGFAGLIIGSYTCADGQNTCTLGGVTTGRLDGTDPKAAAEQDIAAAAKESYGTIKGHQELKSEAVTVNGSSGYLVRWKVSAQQGNDGYVETVVFPGGNGKSLASVHLGFDIADKAPSVDQMDSIVNGITAYTGGRGNGGPATGTSA
ncbi:DUF2510 domain-containing protein [Kitasatospora sp. NPDC001175]|uniref:DUF2510 domain-containing protein n=1 Tax=Kitasatospora sp. NPDC001175 TaxID=3157103 RepID=UPI003CFED481